MSLGKILIRLIWRLPETLAVHSIIYANPVIRVPRYLISYGKSVAFMFEFSSNDPASATILAGKTAKMFLIINSWFLLGHSYYPRFRPPCRLRITYPPHPFPFRWELGVLKWIVFTGLPTSAVFRLWFVKVVVPSSLHSECSSTWPSTVWFSSCPCSSSTRYRWHYSSRFKLCLWGIH